MKHWINEKKLLAVGAGGLGRVIMEWLTEKYECAFVDNAYPVGTEINKVRVVGKIADFNLLFHEYKQLVVTIGNNVCIGEDVVIEDDETIKG